MFSRTRRRHVFLFVLRLLIAAGFLLPLLWMAAAAAHPPGLALPTTLRILPAQPTLQNFARLWDLVPLAQYTRNSLLVVALGVPLTLVTASWAGLGMALLPRPAQRRWVLLSLAALMAPGIALWSTRFLVYRALGLYDTIWALIAPAWMGTSPFFVLMFYRAFRRIPAAIYDSAVLDGAGILSLWARIALPMGRTTALGVALLSFVFYWGDFISPLLYLNSETLYTLPVALRLLEQLTRAEWGLLMAAALWTTAIPVGLFLLAQPAFAGYES